MTAPAHCLENRVAIQAGCEKAGQASLTAEERCARIAGTRTPFVAVGIGNDAHAEAPLEGVAQNPLERAPGGMHFDRRLRLGVVGIENIGIASADMGRDHTILALEP